MVLDFDFTTMMAVGALAVASAAVALKVLVGSKKKVALDPTVFIPFKLIDKKEVSHDTRIFRFALPTPDHTLGLPVGSHMSLKAIVDGKEVQRSYTPISSNDDLGYFDLLIKVYFKNVHPKFPEGGKMTQHLESLKIGESILVRGPSGRFEYLGKSTYRTKTGSEWTIRKVKRIGMIAGGSGITPFLQIIATVMRDPEDKTELFLLFANQTEADILLRERLEEYSKDSRLKLWYTLDRPEKNWRYSSGFVNEEMLAAHMPPPGGSPADTIILMCGPPPMVNFACKPNLLKLNFTEEQFYVF